MSTELVIAIYRPREGVEGAGTKLAALLRGHHEVLLREGLVTERPPLLMRSLEDASVLEIFEWASAQAARRAHDNPAVNALWGEISAVAETISLSELEEADRPFPHFEPAGAPKKP